MPERRGYAPFDIVRDAAAAESRFGLVGTRVEATWGSAYARHLPLRQGGAATVFLHGASGAWTGWTPLLEFARTGGFAMPEPVLIDLPGWGDGVLHSSVSALRIEDISDLVRTVLERLGYQSWHLVGHSMGGLIALHLASTSPARVTAVGVVSATSFSIIRSVEHPIREFWSVPAFTMLWRVMAALRLLGRAGGLLLRAATTIGLMRLVFAPLFRYGFRMPASVVLATVDGIDPRAFLAASEVVRGYAAHAVWSKIRCPVNAIAGDRDVFVGRGDLDALSRAVPHARIAVIPDCGHFALVEWPGRVLRGLGFSNAPDGPHAKDGSNSPHGPDVGMPELRGS